MSKWFSSAHLQKNIKLYVSRTSFLFILVLGVALGYSFRRRLLGCEGSASWEVNIETEHKKGQKGYTRHLTGLREDKTNLLSLSEHQYACNPLNAFEELTLLHKKAKNLVDHRRRGEANLARQGTVERKATAAIAAENVFRKCVGVMMPELLTEWEDKLKRGDLTARGWNDLKEKRIDGITFSTLEETADSLG